MKRTVLAVVLLLLPGAGTAQEDAIRRADLPRRVEARLLDLLHDPATRSYTGPATIAADERVAAPIFATGTLTIAGTVEGDVALVGGRLVLEAGARITGDVTLVDAELTGETTSIAGTFTAYSGPDRWARSDRRERRRDRAGDDRDRDWEDDWDRDWPGDEDRGEPGWDHGGWDHGLARWGGGRLGLRVGPDYNRVEGLPIRFGPEVATSGLLPTRLRAHAVWRTASESLEPEDMGYDVVAEQVVLPGGELALGAGAFSLVDPIEASGLRSFENGLSALLFHTDHRDHFERRGWRAYAAWRPEYLPLRGTVTFASEDHGAVAAADPWSFRNGDEPWRPQPLVAEGEIRTLGAELVLDTRRGRRWPDFGWHVRAATTFGLDGDLAVPARVLDGAPATSPILPEVPAAADFVAGRLDVRRYARAGDSELALRGFFGGSLNGEALPPQYQHALGGLGSLPGYSPLEADCGARSLRVRNAAGDVFFPSYGCDRMLLVQAEYRGSILFGFDWGGWDGDEDWREDGWNGLGRDDQRYDEDWWDWDFDLGWLVFLDAGQGWALGTGDLDTGALYDAGVGLTLGPVGFYWAVPLSDSGEGSNFFVRLGRRF